MLLDVLNAFMINFNSFEKNRKVLKERQRLKILRFQWYIYTIPA